MSFVAQHGLVISALLVLPLLLSGMVVCWAALKRYELAFGILLASPWAHWAFASNEEIVSVADAGQETGPGTYLRVLAVLVVGLIGYIRFAQAQKSDFQPLPGRYVLLALFFVCAFLSVAYSIERQFTLIRGTESIAFLGFLLGFYSWLRDIQYLDRALNVLALVLAGGVLVNAASLVLAPDRAWWWEAPHRFQGLTTHPNEVGMMCMVAYPVLMWRFRRGTTSGKAVVGLLFGCALGLHLLSGSRSSFVCGTIGVLLWHAQLRHWMKFALFLLAVAMGATLVSTSTLPSLERDESDEVTDLTGRQQFWLHSVDVVKQKPFLGYGYQVSGQVWSDPRFASALLENSWSSARASLHNGYLDTLIGLGFVGLGAWLIILFTPLAALYRIPVSDYKALCLVSILQLLVLNCVETVITNSRSFGSIAFWCFWVFGGSLPVLMAGLNGQSQDETPKSAPAFTVKQIAL